MSKHKICHSCEDYRSSGEFSLALNCSRCKGTGIVRDVTSYICNGCGKNPCLKAHTDSEGEPYGIIDYKYSDAYASDALTDGTTYTFSLCEDCLRILFDGFVVPPNVGNYLPGGFDSYAEEKAYSIQRKWERGNGPQEKFLAGLCNQFEGCKNLAAFRKFSGYKALTDDVCCFDHIGQGLYSGEMWAPIQDVPIGGTNKEQVVKALLKAMEQPYTSEHSTRKQIIPHCVVYFNFSGEIFENLIGIEDPEDKISIVFFPDDMIPEPEYNIMFDTTHLHCYKIEGVGTLYYYDRLSLERRVKENYRAQSTLIRTH